MKLKTIGIYDDRLQAELRKGLLTSHGIRSVIQADDEGGMMAYPFSLVRGVRLQVAERDAATAKKLIEDVASS